MSRLSILRSHRPRNRRLNLEQLEDRRVLAVVTVDTEMDVVDADDGLTSLREAISATNAMPGPDDIGFDFGHDGPETILLQQGELEITEAVTISGDGPALLMIDAQQQSRILNITAETGDFTIAGMKLTGGRTTGDNLDSRHNTFSGGAIRSQTAGSLTIRNSEVSGNAATGESTCGGGVHAAGSVNITASTISGNSADDDGGAVSANDAIVNGSTISGNSARSGGGVYGARNVIVTDSNITGNDAGYGGGIRGEYGEVSISGSTISGNSAFDGGGVFAHTSEVSIFGSTISGNTVRGHGGGIRAREDVTIHSSTISGNSAGTGGGIGCAFYCQPTIISSTITGNTARIGGGINGGATVSFSTITGNSASEIGGGIVGRDPIVITHSIVAGNTDDGSIPDVGPDPRPFGRGRGLVVEHIQHSLIGDNTGSGLEEAPVGSPDSNGNLIGGPTGGIIDARLRPLASNGGPTQTHSLLSDSPVIDAGDPLATPGVGDVPEFDQRGASPYTRVSGGRIDMGAHERNNLNVEILDVATPTITPVDEVTIQFSSATSGFDVADLELSINEGPNLLTAGQTLSTSDNQTFVLSGLAEVPAAFGYYNLTLDPTASGIVDNTGGPLDNGDRVSWSMRRSPLELTVDTLVDESDGDFFLGDVSLREAIEQANLEPGPNNIVFDSELFSSPQTLSLTLGELEITDPLTVHGAGQELLTIDGQQQSRIFNITSATGDFLFEAVTLTGGRTTAAGGGAIRSLTTGSLTIENSEVSGNSVTGTGRRGGGVFALGQVTVISSTISGNSADDGGGVWVRDNATIISSTISENSAVDQGGGVRARSNVTMADSTISGNSGGGIRADGVTVSGSTISGNSSESSGGGIYGEVVTVTTSTISRNSTEFSGGGIRGEVVTITSSTISGNSAARFGGGISAFDDVTVIESTISGNSAIQAGGISVFYDPVTITNSIVAGNTDNGTAPDLPPGSGPLTVEHSLIGDNTGGDLIEAPVDTPDANGNLIGGPVNGVIDPMLAPLANNGGPTWTQALLPGSPAIDAGDPTAMAGIGGTPEFDQRGSPFTRAYDGDDAGGARIDMGAFELQPQPGDLNGDLAVNFADLTPFALALTDPDAYEATYPDLDRVFLCDASGDGLCNFADLQPFADLLVGGEGAEGGNLESGQELATVPGDLSSVESRRSVSQRAARQSTSDVVDVAGVRDRALLAWLSSLPHDEADVGTESRPDRSEAAQPDRLPTSVVESVLQGMRV